MVINDQKSTLVIEVWPRGSPETEKVYGRARREADLVLSEMEAWV